MSENIKQLVLKTLAQNPNISSDLLIKKVRSFKPDSAFDKKHVSWYKSKIKNDSKLRGEYLKIVKKIAQEKGKKILTYVEKRLQKETNSYDERFHANRYIFRRLQKVEIDRKKTIKPKLYDEKSKCYLCHMKFKSDVDIEVHRLNENIGYHKDNCVLTHQECHRKINKKKNK